jgi:hypothetical protein
MELRSTRRSMVGESQDDRAEVSGGEVKHGGEAESAPGDERQDAPRRSERENVPAISQE